MHLTWHEQGKASGASPLVLVHGVGAGPDALGALPVRLAARALALRPHPGVERVLLVGGGAAFDAAEQAGLRGATAARLIARFWSSGA